MDFAKFWTSEDVAVPDRFGAPATVRVWGASNADEDQAKRAASERATRLLEFFSDPAKANEYEYFNGFIREELIDEITDENGAQLAAITRNHYGALVLNTERVLFGDVDVPDENALMKLFNRLGRRVHDKAYFVDRIRAFQAENKSFAFVVYETSAGLRFVITNREVRPEDTEVQLLFDTLKVDRLYTRLCKTQVCFRARLTPKPWRIGMDRPASRFPNRSDRAHRDFQSWLETYAEQSASASAARRIAEIGTGRMLPSVQQVLEYHDRYACSGLPMLA